MGRISEQRFVNSNRTTKSKIEQELYTIVGNMESYRRRGTPMFCLSGPNFTAHVRNALKLLGTDQKIWVCDIEQDITDCIIRKSKYVKRKYGNKFKIETVPTNAFFPCSNLIKSTRATACMLDLDSNKSFIGVYDDWLDSRDRLKILHELFLNNQFLQRIYIVVTYCRRIFAIEPHNAAIAFEKCWPGLKPIRIRKYKESGGANMATMLLKCEKLRRRK